MTPRSRPSSSTVWLRRATTGTAYGAAGQRRLLHVAHARTVHAHRAASPSTADDGRDLVISTLSASLADGKYYSLYQSGIYNTHGQDGGVVHRRGSHSRRDRLHGGVRSVRERDLQRAADAAVRQEHGDRHGVRRRQRRGVQVGRRVRGARTGVVRPEHAGTSGRAPTSSPGPPSRSWRDMSTRSAPGATSPPPRPRPSRRWI